MSGVAGLRGSGDWGTDERPKNFREGILRFNPRGTAPIFALTSKAGSKSWRSRRQESASSAGRCSRISTASISTA